MRQYPGYRKVMKGMPPPLANSCPSIMRQLLTADDTTGLHQDTPRCVRERLCWHNMVHTSHSAAPTRVAYWLWAGLAGPNGAAARRSYMHHTGAAGSTGLNHSTCDTPRWVITHV